MARVASSGTTCRWTTRNGSPRSSPAKPTPNLSGEEVDAALARLLPLTPFYCIEAWTYYNTRALRNLCRPHELAIVEQWEKAPGSTEDLEKPWRGFSVGKEHNRALAETHFPGRIALQAGRSFADTVSELRRNPILMRALSPLVYPGYEHEQ